MRRARARPFYSSGETNRPTPVPIGLSGSREEARFGRAPPDPRLRLSFRRRPGWALRTRRRLSSVASDTAPKSPAPGSLRQGCLQRERVSSRQLCPHLVRVRLFRHISLHLAGVSLYVTSIPTWRGFFFASPLFPLGEGRLFMAYTSLCDISPQIRE